MEQSTTPWSGHDTAKDRLRATVWTRLKAQGAAVGELVGHIPRFVGSDHAAAQFAMLPAWQQARVIKCNPDQAQAPVRQRALQEGKMLYMAVPRLTEECCFVALAAADLQQRGVPLEVASTSRGAMQHGRLVALDEMSAIDLVVVGCVAVTRNGGRTGKGAGFADLELGLLRQHGLIQANTPIVTTVHALQIVPSAELPMRDHDWWLTCIVTPEAAIATTARHRQPPGLLWERLRPEQLAAIPVLRSKHEAYTAERASGTPSADV
jgi:5-formyltetrahydrofolate cyclo-ligase